MIYDIPETHGPQPTKATRSRNHKERIPGRFMMGWWMGSLKLSICQTSRCQSMQLAQIEQPSMDMISINLFIFSPLQRRRVSSSYRKFKLNWHKEPLSGVCCLPYQKLNFIAVSWFHKCGFGGLVGGWHMICGAGETCSSREAGKKNYIRHTIASAQTFKLNARDRESMMERQRSSYW